MQGGVVELARQAAAAARAERMARGAGRVAVRRYRGVVRRGDRYVAEIVMDAEDLRPRYLGSYATPEEAAYVYDAAARMLHGDKAKPNFPEPPALLAAVRGGGAAPAAGSRRRLPLLGHARMRVAPVDDGGAQRQAFSVEQAPAPRFEALPGPYHAAAGGSDDSAGFYAAGPAFAAAGGSSGEGFYEMADVFGPELEVPGPFLTYAASSALSTTSDKENDAVVDASAAADPKLVPILIIDSDGEPVVDDNFPDGYVIGEYTSSAAPPAVLPFSWL